MNPLLSTVTLPLGDIVVMKKDNYHLSLVEYLNASDKNKLLNRLDTSKLSESNSLLKRVINKPSKLISRL